MLDKQLEQYYSNFFDLFRSKGWKQLTEELTVNIQNINTLDSVKDSEDLYHRKGQLLVLYNLVNLSNTVEQAYEDLKEQSEDV